MSKRPDFADRKPWHNSEAEKLRRRFPI